MKSIQHKKTKAVIVGGGIGGLALALAFHKIGLDYILLEQSSEIKEVGSGITLWSNGVNGLKELGIFDEFTRKAYHAESVSIQNSKGKKLGSIDFSDFTQKFSSSASTIHRADLIEILLNKIPPDKIFLNSKVCSFCEDSQGIKVCLDSGKTIKADILIGADGIHSVIRKHLGDDRQPEYAGYTCWRGITSIRDINIPKPGIVVSGPKRLFGLGWLSEKEWYWFATYITPQGSDLQFEDLCKIFSSWPQNIRTIIKQTPLQSIIRNDIMDLLPKKNWGKGSCTLLGDAAHASTPNLAQGANMAIEDAIELAHSLQTVGNIKQALRDYERKRYPRVRSVVKDSRKLGDIAQWSNPYLAEIKDWRCFAPVGRWIFKFILKKYAHWIPPILISNT